MFDVSRIPYAEGWSHVDGLTSDVKSPAWWLGDDFGEKTNRVWFRCKCGTLAFIYPRQDGWSIDPAGNVTPSIKCLTEGCGFHEMVRLLEWTQSVAS